MTTTNTFARVVLAIGLVLIAAACGGSGTAVPTPIRDYTKGTDVTVHSCKKYSGTLVDSIGESLYDGQGYMCVAGKTGLGTTNDWYYFVGTEGTVYEASLGASRTAPSSSTTRAGVIDGADVMPGSDARCSTDLGVQDGAVVGGNCTVTTSDGKSHVCDRGYFVAPGNGGVRARYFEGCR